MWQINLLAAGTWATLYMVFIASFLSIFFGLCLGILLCLFKKDGLWSCRWVYLILDWIVNITRSVPYIIFMIALIPITRFFVGTSIGTNAAIVPLTLAAIPFYARIAETAIVGVDKGLVEAALSLGANAWQVVRKIWIPEASPELIKGGTLTCISLVGYSAMAGAVGGGGLGEVAIEYGYQRFNLNMMAGTIIILVILVLCVQYFGDFLAKVPVRKNKLNKLWGLCLLFFLGILISMNFNFLKFFWTNSRQSNINHQVQILKIGIVGEPMSEVMKVAAEVAKKKYDLILEPIVFSDYVLPNTALNNGQIDANIFQHIPYLNTQVKAHGYQITWIAKTFVYPMGVYSTKIDSVEDLTQEKKIPKEFKNNLVIAIPNDPSNEGRALLLFQQEKLIKLKPGSGLLATPEDVISNPYGLIFKTLDAAEIPRAMPDVLMAAINNDYIQSAGFTLQQALFHEGPDAPYANIIVVRIKDKNKPIFKQLIAVMHSQPVINETQKEFANTAIPAWGVKN